MPPAAQPARLARFRGFAWPRLRWPRFVCWQVRAVGYVAAVQWSRFECSVARRCAFQGVRLLRLVGFANPRFLQAACLRLLCSKSEDFVAPILCARVDPLNRPIPLETLRECARIRSRWSFARFGPLTPNERCVRAMQLRPMRQRQAPSSELRTNVGAPAAERPALEPLSVVDPLDETMLGGLPAPTLFV